jgi:hypothetical protein
LGRVVTIALWRANNKPPVELVVANFAKAIEMYYAERNMISISKKEVLVYDNKDKEYF